MRVFITGGSGLIGACLVRALVERGDTPLVLSRQADKARLSPRLRGAEIIQGDPTSHGAWERSIDGCDAVVNLVGHNLFAERWSPDVLRKIRDSRVIAAQNVAAAIARSTNRPKTLIQGSAVGYYGPHEDETLIEDSAPGHDFMAGVCREWEAAALPVQEQGVRLVILRTGIVLAKEGGALSVMAPIFKLGPGAPVGGGLIGRGRQWMSWIHLDDVVGMILLGLDNPAAHGPMNATAPEPARNSAFSKALSAVLWKPTAFWRVFVPIGPPDFLLKLVLGDVAQIITTGARVLPEKAERLGYRFKFPYLNGALRDIFGAQETPAPAGAVIKHA